MKPFFSKMKMMAGVVFILALIVGVAMPMQTAKAAAPATIVYDAIPNPLPPNMASQPFQAGQASEFGDYIHLAGTNRLLSTVTVTMSDWALYSTYPAMPSGGWTHPITLNIYNVIPGAPLNTLGSLLGTVTQTFTIPWRPAEDPIKCPTKDSPGYAYKWQSTPGAPDTNCNNGLAFNITFDMSSLNVTLPNDIIVGVAYNTQSYGVAPVGVTGPYDSLNVGALGSATVGTDDNTDRVFFNSLTPSQYGDGGAGGVGIFREDINWTPYGTVPIQITAAPLPVHNVTQDTYYLTIQAAVDAANDGDTINVAAGTYNEQVTIAKPLTVTGADGAVLDGTGLAPTWTTGVKIRSGNVTFNNIDVTNYTQDGITAYDNIDMPNLHITNSKISNIQPGYWGFGIYVGYESEGFGYVPPDLTSHLNFTGLLIEGNEITNVHSSALVVQSLTGTPGTLVVRNNNIHDNTTNSGIWIDCARNLLIENNTVNSNKWGIEFSCYAETGSTLNGPYSPKDITLQGNVISNSTNQGIALYEAWPGTITVIGNAIQGNGTGVDNPLAETLIAEGNWWGAASGPGIVGPGTGDKVSANVDFTPWLCDGTDTDPAIGFQPNPTNLCPTIKVHIAKYLDGTQADATSAGGYHFPMFVSWSAANIGSGSGNYVLGNGHGGAPLLYQADTSPMTVDADYTTSEVTSGGSKVRLTCGAGAAYRLVGYKTSSISFGEAFQNGALIAPPAAPTFTGLTADQYIVVLNEKCPTFLTVVKTLVPNTDTGKFNLTIDSTTYATNVGDSGTTGAVALNAGAHTVGETAGTGTSLTDYLATIGGDCAPDGTITLALGENKTCTITNTKANPNPTPKIAVDKQEPVIATGGGPLTYTYKVTNPGNVPLSNVVVSDNKCSPVNYGSGDNGNNLLEPGETWTFTCTYTPSFSSNKLTNKATVTSKFGAATYSATDSATLYPFTLKKKLYLYWDEKSSNKVVYSPPDNTPFTVEIYKNNVLISTITISQNASAKLWLSNGKYTFKEVSVPPGYLAVVSSFTYTTMDGHGFHDECDDGKNLNEWTYPNVITYNLAIDKTGPATARKGATITYNYTVTNSGPASVRPKVTDDKCKDVTYVSGDTDHDGRVDPGETWTFKCNYKVTARIGSHITNKATVSDADQPRSWDIGGDTNTNNNKDTWTLTVIQ